MKKILKLALLFLFSTAGASFSRDPISNGKPTELVIIKYGRLVASGALLTPEGWARTGRLFAASAPYPKDGKILLMSTGGALGEMWNKGERAQVETKWTDYFGAIDSSMSYISPSNPHVFMTVYQFDLVYTNKHREIGRQGETVKEVTGPFEWKIEGPLKMRYSTLNHALAYVTTVESQSDSPEIKKNARKTIEILKRMISAGRP